MFAEFTINGPTDNLVATASYRLICKPFGFLLSLTISAKFILLYTFGNTSQVGAKLLLTTSCILGKYLSGDNDLKLGPTVAAATGGCTEKSLLVCSQQ